jgi:hypothetical protein
MSAQIQNFNTAPYYDDYNEDKKFYKILFKPGYALQARELTQLQTMLQTQIKRHGDNIFKDGSMVIPGGTSVDTNFAYVKVQNSYNNGTQVAYYTDQLVGKFVVGQTSGVRAQIIKVVHTDTVNPETLYVKYMNSGTNNVTKVFADNEALVPEDASISSLGVQTLTSGSTGIGSGASISQGVYYISGFFCLVDPQTIVLDAYSNLPSYRVGLNVASVVVDSEDDESLLDNALGSFNYNAPGADRHSIVLTLAALPVGSTNDANFVELFTVVDGVVQSKVDTSTYNVIADTMARRTYDESGDYTVTPFTLDVREHRNNNRGAWLVNMAVLAGDIVTNGANIYTAKIGGTTGSTAPSATTGDITDGTVTWNYTPSPLYNRGIYTAEQGGDAAMLALGLEPGKAYVRGYEVNKVAIDYLAVPKARDTQYATNAKVAAKVGNYILVTNVNGLPNIAQNATVTLYDQLNASRGTANGSVVGTARVRAFEYDSGAAGTTSAVYKMSLFDVSLVSGKNLGDNVKQFYINNGGAATNFTADIAPYYTKNSGSISASASTTVTGVGTLFQTELTVGDYILCGAAGGKRRVTAIASNISLTVDSAVTVSGEAFYTLGTVLNEPGYSPAIFQMPNYAIQMVRSNDGTIGTAYAIQQYFTQTTNTSGVITLAVSGGNDTFGSEAESTNYVCVDNTTGQIVQPTSIVRNSPLYTQATITFGASYASRSFTVIATVNRVGAGTEKNKTLTSATTTFSTAATAQLKTIGLPVADGYALVSVMMDTGTFASPTGVYTKDISANYTFFDGQTDSSYGQSTITLIDGSPVPVAPIKVSYQYFQHSVTGDYFTVNSYTSTMSYAAIPSYNGVSLRDCIDFRSRIDNTGKNYTSAGAVVNGVPKRGVDITTNYTFYLARKDKLALAIDGTFFDVKGVSSLAPSLPDDPTTAMVLFNVALEAYTFGTGSSNVSVTTIDNKRYTMRDIGKIDARVANLEYYTSLSLLEQQTTSMTIPDSSGLDRYKNGFIVDSFNGHGVGNTTSPDYMCSIDMSNNVLRPFYSMENVTLFEQNTTNTQRATAGYQVTGDVVTLPYSSVALVTQPYASRTENVNPFAVYAFVGSTDLNPSSDEWFDTYQLPDIVTNVDGNFNAVYALAASTGVLGTVWNAWQTQWSGTSVVSTDTLNYGVHTTTVTENGVLRDRTSAEMQASQFNSWLVSAGIGASRQVTTEVDATTIGYSRTGINTQIVPQITNTVTDDKVVAQAVIPYIRSRNVSVVARGLKPNTTFYPFFDGTNVSAYLTPSMSISYVPVNGYPSSFDWQSNVGGLSDEASRTISGNSDNALDRGDVIYVTQRGSNSYTLTTSPATAVVGLQSVHGDGSLQIQVQNIKGTFQAGDVFTGTLSGSRGTVSGTPTVPVKGGALVTTFNGDLVALFQIPNTSALQFRTGTRVFKLTDDSDNVDVDATSSSSVSYAATGVLQTKQAYVTSTRNAQVVQTQVSSTKTVTTTSTRTVSDTGWYDPLAQTFLVQSTDGAFLTEVDLFFQTKDANIPVQVEIREVVNGYPGATILPFSRTVVTPDKVNVSQDGTVATTFKFAAPVYVQDATSYALVVMSDSNSYNVWISQLGDKMVNSDRFISEQPYAGVLFKSQNASTWTADQTQDLKFNIRRASFVTGQYGEVVFQNDTVTLDNLPTLAFQTTSGSKVVRVFHANHGLPVNSTVVIAGVTAAVNGIPAAQLNGSFVVTNVDFDSYTITVATTAATSTGYGGNSGITASGNVGYDSIQPVVQQQTFTDTTTSWFIKTTTGKSPEGAEIPYLLDAAYSPVTVNDTNMLSRTCLVATPANQSASVLAGSKSLFLKGRLYSTNDAVSPFIDMHRLSAILVRNRVNAPTSASTNVAVVDDRVVASAKTTIAFSGNTITTADATTQGLFQTVVVGHYINVAGSVAANNGDWLVTAVATDGSSITTNAAFTTAATGASITITSRELFVDEIAPVNSTTISKYVSTKVNFANTSTYLRIQLAAAVPPAAKLSVYYKVNPAGSTASFDSIPYTLFTPDATIPYTTNNTFTDVTYSLSGMAAFDAVQVKLVMQSSDTSQVPMVKDLRIIACA